MRPEDFRLVGDSELLHLRELLRPTVADWCRRWLGDEDAVTLFEISRAEENATDLQGETWGEWDENRCLLKLVPYVRKKWITTMLGASLLVERETKLTSELWLTSVSDLMSCIGNAIALERATVPLPVRIQTISQEWIRPGKGVVSLQLTGEIGRMDLLLPVSRATSKASEGNSETNCAKLEDSLEAALKDQSLAGEMFLASEELTISELMHLKVGDVIVLNQRCDQPVNLKIEKAEVTVDGYLGRYRDVKAIVVSNAKYECEKVNSYDK